MFKKAPTLIKDTFKTSIKERDAKKIDGEFKQLGKNLDVGFKDAVAYEVFKAAGK
jgi:hypothetical protein